jgi:ABC-type anion transport system duplicated permease subunit
VVVLCVVALRVACTVVDLLRSAHRHALKALRHGAVRTVQTGSVVVVDMRAFFVTYTVCQLGFSAYRHTNSSLLLFTFRADEAVAVVKVVSCIIANFLTNAITNRPDLTERYALSVDILSAFLALSTVPIIVTERSHIAGSVTTAIYDVGLQTHRYALSAFLHSA